MGDGAMWMSQRGVGPVEVRRMADGSVEVEETDGDRSETTTLSADEAADELRPLISVAEANELLDLLRQPSGAPAEDRERKRALRYSDVFDSGSIEDHVQILREIYGHPDPETAEQSNQHRFESVVLDEIAMVLDLDLPGLTAEVRSAARGDAVPAAVDLPDPTADIVAAGPPPPLVSARPVGVMSIENAIAFGPSAVELTGEAVGGIWFGYEIGEPDAPATVAVVHQTYVSMLARLGDLGGIGDRLDVEGGQLIAVDRTAMDDPDMARDIHAGGLGNRPHRALRFAVGGDGTWIAARIEVEGRLVAVVAAAEDGA